MDLEDLKNLVKDIVNKATILKNKHIEYKDTPINYACIFSQNQQNLLSFFLTRNNFRN